MNSSRNPSDRERQILSELGFSPDSAPAAQPAPSLAQPQQAPSGSILDRALAYQDKTQWSSGESVILWKGQKNGRPAMVFLKEHRGKVELCISTSQASIPIYTLVPLKWTWEKVQDLEKLYQAWVGKVQNG